jgi:phosphate starvation-inducible PhoH-like protein
VPPLVLKYEDNRLLGALFGEHDRNLARIEKELGVSVSSRGNRVSISGDIWSQQAAKAVLNSLYAQARRGDELSEIAVSGAIRTAEATVTEPGTEAAPLAQFDDAMIHTRRRPVLARSPMQAEYIRAMRRSDLVFGLGPAGTGKTFLAVAVGVSYLLEGKVERIILSRPAVEAGERLGFLPGDVREKVDPYMRPLYDALYHTLPPERVIRSLDTGEIEIAPLAFMRGRTLADAFVILDEAQNTTPVQMKMLLTRMGENSRMVVTGDLSQVDLPRGMRSGLAEAVQVVEEMEDVASVRFTDADVLRHPLVTSIVRAYDARDRALAEEVLTDGEVEDA